MNSAFPPRRPSTPSAELPASLRAAASAGRFTGQTAGQAPGFVQANLVILPENWAGDFLRYCLRNPKPCPLLAVGEPGNPVLQDLGNGHDIDIRTALPAYHIYRDGALEGERTDISDLWTGDMVAFAIGCSFSFEEAMINAGLPLRHVSLGRNVPMFITDIASRPSGSFNGPLVVTMRQFSPQDAIRAIEISSHFPKVHGAPVHIGDPAKIGITDLTAPDFGDSVPVSPEEIAVFWACGVTPQMAVRNARPPICITHKPGCMLVTDITNQALSLS